MSVTHKILSIFLLISLFSPVTGYSSDELMTVAVVEFDVKGDIGIKDAGAIIAEWMISAVDKTQQFNLKERVLLKKVLEEQEMGMSGLIDGKTAAKIGKLYGVKGLITGSVLKWGDTISVTARLIDTDNGSILKTADVKTTNVESIPHRINELAEIIAGKKETGKVKTGEKDLESKKPIGGMFVCEACPDRVYFGQEAPVFSLKDINDIQYDLSLMKERPMVILYFFNTDLKSSQEGLITLNQLSREYKGEDLTIWAITLSPKKKISDFLKSTAIDFPLLLDSSNTSAIYKAGKILPSVCIIGPGLKVLDYFQGDGKTTEKMLVRVAERKLQQKQTAIAKAISEEVLKKNPGNVKALAVKGYAALKENNLEEAEKTFQDLALKKGEGEVLGKEGLAAVYASKEQPEQALQLIKEVEQLAPERAFVHVIKGDLLYSQNKKKEAEAEYKIAVKNEAVEPYQDAVRYNQLGRFYASTGQPEKALELYDRAMFFDPYYIEGITNSGLVYEKEGKWDKALESYRQALSIEQNDNFAVVLAKKAQEMLELNKDVERSKRVDTMVKELAERYKKQQKGAFSIFNAGDKDTWTSRPVVLTFVDFQEKGGLSERDGFSAVLMAQLAERLNASGRVQVVERVLIERLLEELNLGSSELANQETALRLGNIMAAKLIGTGSIFYLIEETLITFRLIDTETSAIPKVTTRRIDYRTSMDKELAELNNEILETVILKYPLRGYLIKNTGEQFILNLGSKQGVTQGAKFDVVEEQQAVKFKGKTLPVAPVPIGQVEVVSVQPDLSFVKVISQGRPLKADDKVQEKIEKASL